LPVCFATLKAFFATLKAFEKLKIQMGGAGQAGRLEPQ
jgi:hypothetical protein